MTKRLVVYCLLGFLALLGVGVAHAQTNEYFTMGTQKFGTAEAACVWSLNDFQSRNWYIGYTFLKVGPLNTGNGKLACWAKKAGNSDLWYSDAVRQTCAVGQVFDPASGTCGAAPNPCGDKNEFIRRWNYPQGGSVTPPPSSYDGCAIETIKMLVCRKDPAGVTYCMWLVRRTGEKSSAPPDPGASSAPDNPRDPPSNSPPIKPPPAPPGKRPCPEGTVQAGSDDHGTPICMGQGSNPQNPPAPPPKIETEKDETLPDGSTKTTKTTTTTNSDGSTTTNTQVTIVRPDGSKESSGGTITSPNSAGMAGRADTPENDKYDLCKQNPHLSICRESSVSGTCGQVTCIGDAIQCATLRAAAAMQCEQQADKEALQASPSKALGDQVLSGNDPMKGDIAAALKGTEVDLSKTTLDQGGFVGGGACFPDKTFTVVGKPVTVSFARVCQDIQPLRAAVMACAFIIAYLIVGRSVVQG